MSCCTPRFSLAHARPWLAALVLFSAWCAQAQPSGRWLAPHLANEQPTSYFTNLEDGATIETPFVLKFGLSHYGVGAISKAVPKAGHHHLLINRELPMDFKQPLPFNEQYLHFGKGQMETVLNLKPGSYTLRLVLADHQHIPNFVYSKPVRVTVSKFRATVDPKSLTRTAVSMLQPASGATLGSPFRVQFHASGYNISHAAIAEEGLGHFRLVLQKAGGGGDTLEFKGGETEAMLKPPAGDYTARLELVSNASPNAVMASSEPVSWKVQGR